MKQETLEEASYNYAIDKMNRTSHLIGFREGAKWQQDKLSGSEVLQRIRESKSDAEARRIIKTI